MGKFKEYFERAKSTGLNESIKVPFFENKENMVHWLFEIANDVDLSMVVARDDVYDFDNETLLIGAGDSLLDLQTILLEQPVLTKQKAHRSLILGAQYFKKIKATNRLDG